MEPSQKDLGVREPVCTSGVGQMGMAVKEALELGLY